MECDTLELAGLGDFRSSGTAARACATPPGGLVSAAGTVFTPSPSISTQ